MHGKETHCISSLFDVKTFQKDIWKNSVQAGNIHTAVVMTFFSCLQRNKQPGDVLQPQQASSQGAAKCESS